MSTRQFYQESSKGFPSPVYVLYSSDDFLLYEALSILKETYHSADAFNFDIFDAKSPDDNSPMEQIVDVLNTLPFLSGRRVVVLENIQKLARKDAKKLEPYLSNPSGSSLLVMLCEGAAPKVFEASTLKNVKVIGLNVQEKDIPLWIKDRAKIKGVAFSDAAVEYLIGTAGTDLGMLYAEIEKFSIVSSKGVIDVGDIKDMVYAGAENSAFDLINALMVKNAREVFRIYEKVRSTTEPQMLLGALNWQYAKFWSKSQPRERRRYAQVFRLLHEADAAIKRSTSFVIETLLVQLLDAK